jgi:hypothetical protein
VTLKNAALCRSVKGTDGAYHDQPITQPFAFDFGTLQHGWVKFPAKGSGQRAGWDLVPASQSLADERDDWVAAATCTIASAELGGLARLECTNPALAASIVDLHDRYLSFRNASEDKIPIVRQVIDPVTAVVSFEITGWTPRPAVFGERLNPVPSASLHEPIPNAASNGSGKHDPDILENLRSRKAEAARLQDI